MDFRGRPSTAVISTCSSRSSSALVPSCAAVTNMPAGRRSRSSTPGGGVRSPAPNQACERPSRKLREQLADAVDADRVALLRRRRAGAAGEQDRVHAHERAVGAHQRPAGVARAEGGVGLDEVVEARLVGRGDPQRRPHRRDDPGGRGERLAARSAHGVAERHDGVALLHGVLAAERDGAATLEALHLEQGEVLARRGGADLGVVEPVRRAGLELLAERDHVEVREHEALVGVHEHAGAARLLAEPAARGCRPCPGAPPATMSSVTAPDPPARSADPRRRA